MMRMPCPPTLSLPHEGGREAPYPEGRDLRPKGLPPPLWGRVGVGGPR